ncbi:MlaD family protein [Gordonia araii]|nr:MlaD family protein [Gordonia araii]NNG98469.1 MCE family protein [Gordonia araii NBRC 100433]
MLKKLASSKWLMSGLVIAGVIALGVGYLGFQRVTTRTVSYCAELDDGIGIFAGNAVMRRGVQIGTVSKIESSGGSAKVTFSVDADQPLPADVQATSVAPSIIAVRQLALLGDYRGGPKLAAGACIPRARTATPATISETLQSVNRLARQLTIDGGPQQTAQVMKSISTISGELDGVGPVLNGLIKQLAVPARTPIAGALGDMATALDSTSALTVGLADNWGVLRQLVDSINGLTEPVVAPLIKQLTRIAYALPEILVSVSSLIDRYQHFAWPALDVILPITRIVGAGFRNWGDLLGIVPVIIRAFDVSFDQKTLGLRIGYKPPRTRIPAKNPKLTCANVNRFLPGQCRVVGPDAMELDALRALMLMTGAGRP